ncbi:MAG: hypothetical protein LBH54_00145, partial [Clostridiales bacterium]|nr:hypothetical protein [Clostridiales bacterium]
SGYEIYQNTFYNVATPIFIHGGHDFNIYDNTVADSLNSVTLIKISKTRYDIDNDAGFFLLPNYLNMPVNSEPWRQRYPHLANLINEPYELPLRNVIERTLSYKSQDVSVAEQALPFGRFENNYATSDALPFRDAAAGDFSLTEAIPGFEDFKSTDYSSVGLRLDENRSKMPNVPAFRLIYPRNGTLNVAGNKLRLSWQPVVGATKYRVTIAGDRAFYGVAEQREVSGTTMLVNGLAYGGRRYYWKVEALGTSRFRPFVTANAEGVAGFTTAMTEILDKTALAAALDQAEQLAKNAVTGENVGDYSADGKVKFEQIVADAREARDGKTASQNGIDEAVAALEAGIANFEASRKSGNVSMKPLITNPVGWKADNANFIRVADDILTFLPAANGGVVAGYQEVLPSYPIWTFQAKFDLTANWQGFGMRAADPTSVGWSTTSYMIILKEDVIELHRFYLGGKTFEVIPNEFIRTGEWHGIELGTVDLDGGGVHIIFKVDGKTVFDVEDTDGYIPDYGLLTIYASTGRAIMLAGE